MAEKIYPATEHKRRKEREKGNVAKSTDIVTIGTLYVSLSFIYFYKDNLFELMEKFLVMLRVNITKDFNVKIMNEYFTLMLKFILPLLLVVIISGFLTNYFQVGLKFSVKSLAPDPKKLNPINGFKRMFSKDSIVELCKALFKVVGVIYIAFTEIKTIVLSVNNVYTNNAYNAFSYIFDNVYKISTKIIIFLFAISIADFAYKKFKFEKDLRMTREEMMEEFKQTEGNPHTKNRQKELGRMLSKKQIQKVKEATVLITNPTHFAVALKYELNVDYAPVVLFKGVDEVALSAKKIAKENNIPMIENKPLARELYLKSKEGGYIPEDLFAAVADVITYIYTVDQQKI